MKCGNWLSSLFGVFIILFMSLITWGCRACSVNSDNPSRDTIYVERCFRDTVYVVDTHEVDSLAKCLEITQDSIRFYRDTIRYEDYINKRKIEKVKYYITICEKNTKNKKFFFGWIKRTISE